MRSFLHSTELTEPGLRMLDYMYVLRVSHAALKLTCLSHDQTISQVNKEDLSQACGTFFAE